jgi:hypothetical protein
MNMPIKFDTLEYTRSLIEAGIPAAQAEAQALALRQAMAEATVSPSEMVLLRTDMIARIEMLRADIYAKLEALEERFNAKLEDLRKEFNAKLEALEQRFDAKLAALEQRLKARFVTMYWLFGVSLTLHAVTIGMLMRLFDRLP